MMRILVSILFIAACDGRVHHGLDARPSDASPDTLTTAPGDPPPDATRLTITRRGMPIVGAAVIFQATDSTPIAAMLTNDQGLAWAVLPPSGGFVTAIEHTGNGVDELTTFSRVEQSESLVLELDPTGLRTEFPLSVMTTPDGGASGYLLYSSCGGPYGITTTAFTDIQLAGCDEVADMLVVSLDTDGQPINTSFTADVLLTNPTIMLTAPFTGLVATSFTYTNIPASVSWISTYHALANGNGRTYDQTDGTQPVASGANLSMWFPAANEPTLTVTTGYAPNDVGQQLVYEERAAMAGPYALDFGGALLPSYTQPPAYDPATRTVAWTERSGGVIVDLVRTRIHVYRDDIPSGRAWGWRMIAPRTGTAIVYPQLPNFGFDFNVASGDIVGVDELTTVSVPGGYPAVRATGFGDFTNAITSTGGRLVVQVLSPPML